MVCLRLIQIGDPRQPDHVIWTTNAQDFNLLKDQNANVVLHEDLSSASGSESATDLFTLFLRAGSDARYVIIQTPHTMPRRLDSASVEQSNLTFIRQMLGHFGLECCDNQSS